MFRKGSCSVTFRVPNWSDFQHYKQRTPPWIKLHRQLLDNEEFACLPVASRALAPLVWILASESETGGELPSLPKMAWRLRMSESELTDALEPLVSVGFVEDASGLLARCKQQPIPRQRREEEEAEAEKRDVFAPARSAVLTDAESSDVDTEELQLMRNLVALRDSGADPQAVCDSLERPKGQAPFNAFRALMGGKSGIPRTPGGLTVRRRLNDALEARQRAQEAPVISDSNRKALDAIDRVAARMIAKRDGTALPKEIAG